MRVRVKLFAAARELAGASEVAVEVPRRRDGRRRASERCWQQCPRLARIVPHALLAVDAEFAPSDATASPSKSEVALIPPVSGG